MPLPRWLPGARTILAGLNHLRRPEALVFLPAAMLAGFWIGGEELLLILALGLPLLFGLTAPQPRGEGARIRHLPPHERVLAMATAVLTDRDGSGRRTACLVLQLDDFPRILRHHGRVAEIEAMTALVERVRALVRVEDRVLDLHGGGVAVLLAPVARLDLESLVQLAARLQEGVAAPGAIRVKGDDGSAGAIEIDARCSTGFCLGARAPAPTGRALLDAAQVAADEAVANGPGAIRAFSPDLAARCDARRALRGRLVHAFENGEIRPHFQPQLSMDTGRVSGVEALARWHHPERGCLTPAEFLAAVEANGLHDQLGDVILFHALAAIAGWDRAGLHVPMIAVNFSMEELRDPQLPDRIRWNLDRFDLVPERLTIEVLETVIAGEGSDTIAENLARLARMGCGIDLDDFGTGQASIAAVRRFSVHRIKIDQGFVTGVDQGRDQQRMISAIVSLAEQLGIATLAEGVETREEQAMLAQLGCNHVQGFAIARPMALDEVTGWLAAQETRAGTLPPILLRRS